MSFCTLCGFRQFRITLVESTAGTTGLEPATSAVTVLRRKKHGARLSKRERRRMPMFIRACRVFPPLPLVPSDTERFLPIWAGRAGLRHKARHKFSDRGRIGWWTQNWAQPRSPRKWSRRDQTARTPLRVLRSTVGLDNAKPLGASLPRHLGGFSSVLAASRNCRATWRTYAPARFRTPAPRRLQSAY
jgi:hypothetical protein